MEVLRCREFDDPNAIKRPACRASFFELVADGHGGKSLGKGLGKCASLPSFSSLASPEEDEVGTVLRRILSAGSLHSHFSFSVSSPVTVPSKLVSALKGSRMERGMTPEKLRVTWAPDVYDPPPTSPSRLIINRKQQKWKKNNMEKKKNGKKGVKGSNLSRVSAGGGRVVRRSSGTSYKWPKDPVAEGGNPAHNINDFNVGMLDPYYVSNFLIQSYNAFHYSVAEALYGENPSLTVNK